MVKSWKNVELSSKSCLCTKGEEMKMDEIMDDHILETAHTMKTDENH